MNTHLFTAKKSFNQKLSTFWIKTNVQAECFPMIFVKHFSRGNNLMKLSHFIIDFIRFK